MKIVGGGADHPVVVAPAQSRFLAFPHSFTLVEPEDGSLGPTFPQGFLASGVAAGLKESGRPDMGVLTVAKEWRDKVTSAAESSFSSFGAAERQSARVSTGFPFFC